MKKEIIDSLKIDSEAYFLEAQRAQSFSTSGIPPWLILLLIILGWNEFVMIISSPLYLFLAILCGILGFLVYHLKLIGPISNAFNFIIGSNPFKIEAPQILRKSEKDD